jgi:hypothetical protein
MAFCYSAALLGQQNERDEPCGLADDIEPLIEDAADRPPHLGAQLEHVLSQASNVAPDKTGRASKNDSSEHSTSPHPSNGDPQHGTLPLT